MGKLNIVWHGTEGQKGKQNKLAKFTGLQNYSPGLSCGALCAQTLASIPCTGKRSYQT